MSPRGDELFDNKLTLSSLDSDTTYVLELHAEHVHGAFKTKTVDVAIRTLAPLSSAYLVHNLSAFQFVDMNQILVMWSSSDRADFTAYEIRYWPKENFDKASVISIRAPAQNFTFKNSNPNVISSTQYVFQIRARVSRGGWTAYSEPPSEAVKISSVSFFYAREPHHGVYLNPGINGSTSSIYANWMVTKHAGAAASFTPIVSPDKQFVSINMQSINGNGNNIYSLFYFILFSKYF